MLRNKVVLGGLVISLGLSLGGCSLVAKPADMTTESPTKVVNGELSGAGGIYYLEDSAGVRTEVDSRKVDLSGYVGKTVEAKGEFSGTTLFIDEVKID